MLQEKPSSHNCVRQGKALWYSSSKYRYDSTVVRLPVFFFLGFTKFEGKKKGPPYDYFQHQLPSKFVTKNSPPIKKKFRIQAGAVPVDFYVNWGLLLLQVERWSFQL